jgi:hypothetical protein
VLQIPSNVTSERVYAVPKMTALVPVMINNSVPGLASSCAGLERSFKEANERWRVLMPLRRMRYVKSGRKD